MPNSFIGRWLAAGALLTLLFAFVFNFTAFTQPQPAVAAQPLLFGTLQSDLAHADQNLQAGAQVVTVSLSWKQYEPQEGVYNSTYITSMKQKVAAFKQKGMVVVLGMGTHHVPDWVFAYPNSRYVNQYGDVYSSAESGKNVANLVFNKTLREKQAAYYQRVFQDFGSDIYAARLGGGWYGELNYPDADFNGRSNSYWAYDANAKGVSGNLPVGIVPNPVPAWIPGVPSTNQVSARLFANWYLDSLKNYHDWQIATARQYYSGKLLMLYPSWGIRPGQLEEAIATNLGGNSTVEVNKEIQRGFDFARYIGGITDPNVVVYTTWLNANTGNDESINPKYWNPVHYLAYLAEQNPLKLAVWGENTGVDTLTDMQFSFAQMAKYNLMGVIWAFEPELYATSGGLATINDYQTLIRQYQVQPSPTPIPSPTSVPSPTPSPVGDVQPPSITITQPGANTKVGAKVSISATAADNVSVQKVEFLIDGQLLSSDFSAPYTAVWQTKSVSTGNHTITAKTYDSSGNTAVTSVTVIK